VNTAFKKNAVLREINTHQYIFICIFNIFIYIKMNVTQRENLNLSSATDQSVVIVIISR